MYVANGSHLDYLFASDQDDVVHVCVSPGPLAALIAMIGLPKSGLKTNPTMRTPAATSAIIALFIEHGLYTCFMCALIGLYG